MLLQFVTTTLAFLEAAASAQLRKTCIVPASGSNETDDAPAIINAFKSCGSQGRVVFSPTTYCVNSVMNITWLDDVEIDLYGKLLVRPTLARIYIQQRLVNNF